MNFKDKYIKYKFKYLQLKYQYGGFPDDLKKIYMPPQLKSDGQKQKQKQKNNHKFCIYMNTHDNNTQYKIKCIDKETTHNYKCNVNIAQLQIFIKYINTLCKIKTICNNTYTTNLNELNKRKQQRNDQLKICETYKEESAEVIRRIGNLKLKIYTSGYIYPTQLDLATITNVNCDEITIQKVDHSTQIINIHDIIFIVEIPPEISHIKTVLHQAKELSEEQELSEEEKLELKSYEDNFANIGRRYWDNQPVFLQAKKLSEARRLSEAPKLSEQQKLLRNHHTESTRRNTI